jgi:hypothetical protein
MWAGTTNLVNKPDPQPTVEQEEEESGRKMRELPNVDNV